MLNVKPHNIHSIIKKNENLKGIKTKERATFVFYKKWYK